MFQSRISIKIKQKDTHEFDVCPCNIHQHVSLDDSIDFYKNVEFSGKSKITKIWAMDMDSINFTLNFMWSRLSVH